ncbi:MAG UNVERIFIED_CONTAM: hypothetical protein LVR18_46790 [Planctomycetaceae bacterium]
MQTLEGVTTEQAWTPEWASNATVVELIPVDGWNDKYIQMPKGAATDILLAVSQGSPQTQQETVGKYRDSAVVFYDADRTAFNSSTYYVAGQNRVARDADQPASGARWHVSYKENGRRTFSIFDGRDAGASVSTARKPVWQWPVDSGNATFDVGTMNGRLLQAPAGYRGSTADDSSVKNTYTGNWVAGYYDISGWWNYGGSGQVTFYQDGGLNGESLSLYAGEYPDLGKFDGTPKEGSHWKGTISSFTANSNIKLELWGQVNFAGDRKTFGGDFANDALVNDWYQSVKVYINETRTFEFREDYTEWDRDWVSTYNDITDTRKTLSYSVSTNTHDIFGRRDRFRDHDYPIRCSATKNRNGLGQCGDN